ncbi:hypothetical protein KFU94_41760 [Chloroflexi bacterium TSY]|nr:hypothetical protein [Chloroflexi bacterium TSY]
MYQNLSRKRKQRMFAYIAAKAFEKENYFFTEGWLEEQIEKSLSKCLGDNQQIEIEGKQVLDAIVEQHGIFVERSTGVYSFAHLAFQEYYTAKYFVDEIDDNTLENLIHNYLDDARWKEVILLSASMLNDPYEFIKLFRQSIDQLLDGPDVLIGLLVLINKDVTRKVTLSRQVIDRAHRLFLYLVEHIIANLVVYLGQIIDTHSYELCSNLLLDVNYAKANPKNKIYARRC